MQDSGNSILPERRRRLLALRKELPTSIRGQPDVLSRFTDAVERRELNAIPQRGLRGRFWLDGPTGSGKTTLATTFSDKMFGQGRLVRFDCSEFKTLRSAEFLLGDRSGDRGLLGQAHDRTAQGVWLLDEAEKAHREMLHLILQVTDAARVTLACGETLDLRGIYLVATSNLGAAEILEREHLPFTSLERHVIRSVERFLGPELLGRFGKPYVFRPLSREVQLEITQDNLNAMTCWQAQQGRQITIAPPVVRFLVQRGFSSRLGARPLLDTIDELVGNAIKDDLLGGGSACGTLIVCDNRLKLVR